MKGWSSILLLLLIGVLAWLIYEKLSGGGGDTLFGSGSSNVDEGGHNGGTPTSAAPAPKPDHPVSGVKPAIRPKALAPAKAYSLADVLGQMFTPHSFGPSVLSKMPDSKLPYDGQIQAIAKRVAQANKDAAMFRKKSGITTNISRALAELKSLNDTDFGKVIKTWQVIDNFNDPLSTDLCGAYINTNERSNFLNRLNSLGFI